MSIVLSIVAIVPLVILIAASIARQRTLGAEEERTHDRERLAPGKAQEERLSLRRARIEAGEPPLAVAGVDPEKASAGGDVHA